MQTLEEAMKISKEFPGKIVVFDLDGNIEEVKKPDPKKEIPSDDSA